GALADAAPAAAQSTSRPRGRPLLAALVLALGAGGAFVAIRAFGGGNREASVDAARSVFTAAVAASVAPPAAPIVTAQAELPARPEDPPAPAPPTSASAPSPAPPPTPKPARAATAPPRPPKVAASATAKPGASVDPLFGLKVNP